MQGLITKIVSNQYQVTVDDKNYQCIARGKLRLNGRPLVGDLVLFTERSEKCSIETILPRRNRLVRPAIANVDQVVLVMSATQPEFSTTLVDRLSFCINYENLPVNLIVTKLDLLADDSTVRAIMAKYQSCGFTVVDAFDVTGLLSLFENKITVLAGQSGVGKSTSLNRLNPEFDLVTQEIFRALKRGKHTTRYCSLYPIGSGWVADTPGFSSIDWSNIIIEYFSNSPSDWQEFLGQCKYRNCIHEFEPGCKIKEMVQAGKLWEQRYQHYLDCLQLIRATKKKVES